MRYYFNFKDGQTMLDDEGMELSDMDEVKTEAARSSGEMLREIHNPKFWAGEPWVLWVTDQPNGGGNTLMTLTFNARLAW